MQWLSESTVAAVEPCVASRFLLLLLLLLLLVPEESVCFGR